MKSLLRFRRPCCAVGQHAPDSHIERAQVKLSALSIAVIIFIAVWSGSPGRLSAQPPRPQLQIINGGDRPVEIFWLKGAGERVSNGTVPPGEFRVITTTLGHRFAIVDQEDQAEAGVTATLPVQAFRYQPPLPAASLQAKPTGDATADGEVIPPPSGLGIPAFYSKFISAGGYPIVASANVSDYALKEAAYLVNLMLSKRPDLREAMIQSGSRLCIMAYNEFTTDLPEFQRLANAGPINGIEAKQWWDRRARGLGGSQHDPYCSCAEENLLGYPGDPYAAENILIHEFAHNIHLRGLLNIDVTFDHRLKATYQKAMSAGLWKGKYAATNHHEYFAEGVQSWFDNNRENDHDHNHVNTRLELEQYDPGLADLCREVFGDTILKYTKPATRLENHLSGFDPSQSPQFVWPERLFQAKADLSRPVDP